MNGLTFAQHIVAFLDIILILMSAAVIGAVLLGVILGVKDIIDRKIEDHIQYDDDERAADFLAETEIEENTKEN